MDGARPHPRGCRRSPTRLRGSRTGRTRAPVPRCSCRGSRWRTGTARPRAGGRTRTPRRPGAIASRDDHRQQHEVHERVAHADELLQRRRRRVVRDRTHEERPRDDAETDRDDQRVDEAFPVATRAAPPDEQQDAGDEAGVHREVEDVTDRRERQRGAEELLVVVGDDVAGDEERLAECEQVPRRLDRGLPHPHRLHDRDRRRQCDEVEDEALPEPGDEQVREERGFRSHQVEKPRPLLHRPRYRSRRRCT